MPDPSLDPSHRVAIIQRPPVSLDRAATIERVLASLDEAVGGGARLVVFPEAYVPGYPEYIWGLRPGDDGELSNELHGRLIEQAVDLEGDD
ncbi:MAG: nitrilase-related carbon-nitrogen hydrolase, partial [Actinomycetota bacterium]